MVIMIMASMNNKIIIMKMKKNEIIAIINESK